MEGVGLSPSLHGHGKKSWELETPLDTVELVHSSIGGVQRHEGMQKECREGGRDTNLVFGLEICKYYCSCIVWGNGFAFSMFETGIT